MELAINIDYSQITKRWISDQIPVLRIQPFDCARTKLMMPEKSAPLEPVSANS